MSNPSPEPSAESLAEAREIVRAHGESTSWRMALALDAAKRSSRREALGQAAKLAESHCLSFVQENSGPAEMDAGSVHNGNVVKVALVLRALMEAE